MKFFFAFLVLTLAINGWGQDCRGDFKMNVSGFKSSQGQVKFDLDNSADTFKPTKNGKKSFIQGKAKISDQKVEYFFNNVPCGDYAIKLYHDENSNEDLDLNFLKVPKEDYTFSNCAGCLIPPTWEKAKFRFDKETPEITIVIK